MKRICCPIPASYASRDTAASATSITTVESPATTSGNLMVVAVRYNSTTVTVTSVTDTAGNTYTKIDRATSSVTGLELWYAWNIVGNAANFITANFSSSVGSRVILAAEFEGALFTSDPFDVTAKGTASGQSATTGAFTTNQAEELIVAVSQHEAANTGWEGYRISNIGVVAAGNSTTQVVAMAVKIVITIQTAQTITLTSIPSVARQIIMASFKLQDATSSGTGGSYGSA